MDFFSEGERAPLKKCHVFDVLILFFVANILFAFLSKSDSNTE
jgi:hypothetical protein